jgi:predicted membrane-bound dolichyl-phosphate-mannose-protein mannosyltransferase
MSIKVEIDFLKYIKSLWHKISKIGIEHVLLLSLALHLFLISIPSDGFIFDEAHYVPAALKTLQLQPANAEHPPLTKIIIAISIGIFGNYWFAWRIPIILFGLASLFMVYLVAKQFMTEKYALLSTAFLSFDTMFFVHASIAILDMPEVFFSITAIYLFLKKKYYWSSLAFAVAFLCQERTLFFIFFLLIYILFSVQRFIKDK